jgi:protein associated with RNAse G/E
VESRESQCEVAAEVYFDGTSMNYLNAALDIVIVALFGWLLLEATNWAARWLHERELRRQRKAEVDAMVEFWRHSDSEFARKQRKLRGERE